MFGASKLNSFLKHPGYNDIGGAIGGIVGGIFGSKGAKDQAESSVEAAEIAAKANKEAAQIAAAIGLPTQLFGHPMGGYRYSPGSYLEKMLGIPASTGLFDGYVPPNYSGSGATSQVDLSKYNLTPEQQALMDNKYAKHGKALAMIDFQFANEADKAAYYAAVEANKNNSNPYTLYPELKQGPALKLGGNTKTATGKTTTSGTTVPTSGEWTNLPGTVLPWVYQKREFDALGVDPGTLYRGGNNKIYSGQELIDAIIRAENPTLFDEIGKIQPLSNIGGSGGSGGTGTGAGPDGYNSQFPGLALEPSQQVLDIINSTGRTWGKSAGMFESLLDETYGGGLDKYYNLLTQISQDDINNMYAQGESAAQKGGRFGIENAYGENPWLKGIAAADTKGQLQRLLQSDQMYQGALSNLGNLSTAQLNQYIGAMRLPEIPARFGKEFSTGIFSDSVANYMANAGNAQAAGAQAKGDVWSDFWGGMANSNIPNAVSGLFKSGGQIGSNPQYSTGNLFNPTGFNTGVGGSGYSPWSMGGEQASMLTEQWPW